MLFLLLDNDLENYTITHILDEKQIEYKIIILNKFYIKMKQQILSSCDKNNDILIYLNEDYSLEKERFLKFLYDNGYKYTGPPHYHYDISRQEMKTIAITSNILTPGYVFIYSSENLQEQIKNLKYPMFVKPENGADSNFIDNDSKVNNFVSLDRKTKELLDIYGGVLIEEFIEGRELSIAVYGNEHEINTYDPVEYVFKDSEIKFLTSSYKNDYDSKYWYEKIDNTKIINKCKKLAESFFKAMDTNGYYRLDLRMDSNDDIYFLEINSYPSIFKNSGSTFDTILKCNEIEPSDFLQKMIKYSNKKIDTLEVKLIDNNKHFGIFSTKKYEIDDIVYDNNKTNFRIIDKSYNNNIYKDYGYPINQSHIVIWSNDYNNWRPINHSCDPNCKYLKLKLIACKKINVNDEITIDYNTFCVDLKFTCNCNSNNCRKNITCLDYNTEWFKNNFSDSDVTPYIKMLQNYNQLIKIINKLNDKIEIKYDRETDSFYIVASKNILKNELITNLDNLSILSSNNKYAITKNLSEYYDTETSVLQYTNHSCCPNMIITKQGSDFVANQDIKKGEMITFNYNTTEFEIIRPFDCLCKNNNCIGLVRGFKYLEEEQQIKLLDLYQCSPLIQNYGKKIKTKIKIDNNKPLNLLMLSPYYVNYEYKNIDLHTKIHKYEYKLITNNDIDEIINDFHNTNYDCIINLCDGYNGDPIEPGLNILKKLESNLIPFSGSSSEIYDIAKADIQKSGYSPKFQTYFDYLLNGLQLEFPLFIKPNNLGGSLGIDDKSIVYNIDQLNNKLNDIIKITKDILIQQYIDGDEYTCLVFTNKNNDIICLEPIKIKFMSEIKYKTCQLKNVDYNLIQINDEVNNTVLLKIKNIIVETYKKLSLNSYIRIDIRIDQNGRIYIIDINPYPGIFSLDGEECMSDFCIKNSYSYDDFIIDIIYSNL